MVGERGGELGDAGIGRSRERHTGAARQVSLLKANRGPSSQSFALGKLLSSNSNL